MYRVSTGEELVRIDDSYVGRVTILNEELFAIVRQSSALDVHSLANGEFVDTIKGVDKPLVPAQVDGRSPARMLASGIRGGDYRILTCDLALGSARLAKHLHVPTAWAYHLSEPIAIVSEYPNCVRCISLDPLEVIWQKLEVGFVLAFAFGAQDHAFYMLTMTEDQEYGTIVRVDAATGTTEPVSHAIHKPAYSLLVPDPLMLIGHDGRVHRYVGGWFQEYARLRIGPAPLI